MSELVVRQLGEKESGLLAYESYDAMVDSIRAELAKTESRIIQVRWFVGCQAYIITESNKYGDKSIEEFASAIGLAPSSIYEARRFYLAYSKEELHNKLLVNDISYRRALLFSRCVQEVDRHFLEDASVSCQLTDDEVSELVKLFNSGVAVPKDPAKLKEFLDTLSAARDAEEQELADAKSPLDEVSDQIADAEGREELDDDADYDIDPSNEKAALKAIRDACADVNELTATVLAIVGRAESRVQYMSSLTGSNYKSAEKAFMQAGSSVKEALMAFYTFNTSLIKANIKVRDN